MVHRETPTTSELHPKPIEQPRVARQLPQAAKVVGRIDDAPAEMIKPNAVDDGSPGERVPRIRQPVCQCSPALALRIASRQIEARGQAAHRSQRACANLLAWFLHVSAWQNSDRARPTVVGSGPHER